MKEISQDAGILLQKDAGNVICYKPSLIASAIAASNPGIPDAGKLMHFLPYDHPVTYP